MIERIKLFFSETRTELKKVTWPTRQELKGTKVLSVPIDEASAKLRTGPPGDDEEDYAMDTWAGVVPLALVAGAPQDDPRLREGIPQPEHVRALVQR